MATRRTTRRSLAAGTTGIENDLGIQQQPTAASKQPAIKTNVTTNKTLVTAGKQSAAAKSSTNTLAGTRKRSAFADVTNGNKNKSLGASASTATNKPHATAVLVKQDKPVATATTSKVDASVASSNTARRTYRTRSSTGGSAVKLDDHGNLVPQDGDDDAMMIDAAESDSRSAAEVTVARPARTLKRTASNVSTLAAGPNDGGASKKLATAANNSKRAPLGSKRANATGSTSTAAAAVPAVSKATLALRARQRRELAEQKRLAAEQEVEAARREEEEALAEQRALDMISSEAEAETDVKRFGDDVYATDSEADAGEVAAEGRPKDYGWEDLDEGDEEDPLMVSAYVVEVYEYLRELELTTMPEPDYMTKQNEVTWKMRGILLDWLIEIHTKFRLLPETIFLACNIIDRFLTLRVVSLVKFQLVGVTALFIAAKYEEVVCPSVSNFLYMTDGGYSDEEILKAERYVLSMIDFNLSYPNPINFLRRISKADGYDIQSRTMAKYLMEISVVDHRFMGTPPSMIAAAGNWLARRVLDKGEWDANLVHYSGYTEEELRPTAQLMLDYVVRTSPILSAYKQNTNSNGNPLHSSPVEHELEHPNFIKKYAAKKFFRASTSIRQWAENEFQESTYFNKSTREWDTAQPDILL